ncbi:MAG: CHAD domain-containing protein [Paracoccaceae bacterium]|nr:CHAD domain-containing protein [Paracoccaceae bacterium]
MAYSFTTSDKTLSKGVRRIALEQVSRALDHIEAPELPQDEAVHEIRKGVKKLRSLLRLVRPGLRDHGALDAQLRDAARQVSALRDAAVLLETVNRLAPDGGLPALRTALSAAPHLEPRATAKALNACKGALEAARVGLKHLELASGGAKILRAGLVASEREARTALTEFLRAPTAEAVHAFRKRVKDHLYHARLLTPVWPEIMEPMAAEADRLAETLGQMNDLAVLAERIGQIDLPAADAMAALDLAAAARDDLGRSAMPLARRMFAGTPEDRAARWTAWWQIWREAG